MARRSKSFLTMCSKNGPRRWRKLNSINFGPQVLALVVLLMVAVPLILYVSYSILGLFGVHAGGFLLALSISIGAGCVLLMLFVLLLTIELVQDYWLDRRYRENRSRKIRISEEYYECQFCGFHQVRESDKSCRICGHNLI